MSREYKKRKRAESEAETKLRITEATMHLHETVGPARTTVSGIADIAGVQRATVYRHFPDEDALIDACSNHWATLHPAPDPTPWLELADPGERLRATLSGFYAWYDETGETLALADATMRRACRRSRCGCRSSRGCSTTSPTG